MSSRPRDQCMNLPVEALDWMRRSASTVHAAPRFRGAGAHRGGLGIVPNTRSFMAKCALRIAASDISSPQGSPAPRRRDGAHRDLPQGRR